MLHSLRPYLIFWTPTGESITAGSQALVERFFADAAADSGKASNVFGVLRQYYDRAGFADYRQTFDPARQVIVDTQPYPAQDPECSAPDRAYPTCIGDPQIQAELERLMAADHLPTAGAASAPELAANAPVYIVILPANVDVCYDLFMLCTNDKTGGYHGSFVNARQDDALYAVVPLLPLQDGSSLFPDPKRLCQIDGTTAVQSPNGDVYGDAAINCLSHEYSETITDPLGSAWEDPSTNNEVADKCEMNTSAKLPAGFGDSPNAFLPTLGGSEAAGTLYDQLINGNPYYIQSEWSNGDGNCEMRPAAGRIAPRFHVRGRRKAGASIVFNPAASKSTNTVSSATWNFGDRSKPAFLSAKASLKRVKHRYRRAGRYTLTLTLVDSRGNLKTTTQRLIMRAH